MYGEIACVTMVLLGIEFGYRPRSEGGMEYLIQIDAQNLESLKSGVPLESAIPPKVRDVRAYRITFGTGPLPKTLPPPSVEKPEKPRVPEIEHHRRDEAPPHPRITEETHGDPFRPSHPGSSFPGGDRASAPHWGDIRPGSAAQSLPGFLPREPISSPIPERSTSFSQLGPPATERLTAESKPGVPEETGKKPWMPLVLFVVLFVGSATCNGYLVLLLCEGRRRYRALMERMTDEAGSPT
jgi:hypothetical protein